MSERKPDTAPDTSPETSPDIDPTLLAIIVCPDCRGDLSLTGSELICQTCGLAYPIRDNIPVLLVDEARKPS